jgi:hypothetical protein
VISHISLAKLKFVNFLKLKQMKENLQIQPVLTLQIFATTIIGGKKLVISTSFMLKWKWY